MSVDVSLMYQQSTYRTVHCVCTCMCVCVRVCVWCVCACVCVCVCVCVCGCFLNMDGYWPIAKAKCTFLRGEICFLILECVEVDGEGVGAALPALRGVWHPGEDVGVSTGEISCLMDSL